MGEDEAEIVAGGDNPSVGGINNAAEHVISAEPSVAFHELIIGSTALRRRSSFRIVGRVASRRW